MVSYGEVEPVILESVLRSSYDGADVEGMGAGRVEVSVVAYFDGKGHLGGVCLHECLPLNIFIIAK